MNVQIFSSRSRYFFGRRAMKKWLMDEFEKAGYQFLNHLHIDDRPLQDDRENARKNE